MQVLSKVRESFEEELIADLLIQIVIENIEEEKESISNTHQVFENIILS
jgi:hypothetical protein